MKQINWDKIKSCTSEERKKMPVYIESLIELNYEVEKHGVMGFEAYLHANADPFEKIAIWLVTSGCRPGLCKKLLFQVLNSSCLSSELYLKHIIFSKFIFAICKESISIQELRIKLYSYLGIDYMISLCPEDQNY